MNATSKFGSGEVAAVVMEVDEENSLHLNLKMDNPKGGLNSGVSAPGSTAKIEMEEELERSIKSLTLNTDASANATRAELTVKLGVTRTLSADKERLARKTAWIGETQKEVQSRKAFRKINLEPGVLPRSVWKLMLRKLGAKDKAMLSTMSPLWRDLLKKERTSFLFHEAFPMVHLEGSRLLRADILNCRVVCQEWKKEIENTIQNMLDSRAWPDITGATYAGDNPVEVLHVLIPMNSYHLGLLLGVKPLYNPGNIFISRKICLGMPPTSHKEWTRRVWDVVEDLLRRQWGKEIWQAYFAMDQRLDLAASYNELCKFLKLMPNLRSLAIIGYEELFDEREFKGGKPAKNFYEAIKNRMGKTPLPSLPHLKTIVTTLVPGILVEELLKNYGSTLETTTICDPYESPNVYTGNGNTLLPQLKRLFINDKYLSLKESRLTWNWPALEQLHLMYQQLEAAEIPKIFQSVNGLGGSLRILLLSLHKLDGPLGKLDGTTMKVLSLELPKVERFSLAVRRINLKTIDFILPMVSLKELHVHYVKHVSSSSFEREVNLTWTPEAFPSKPTSGRDPATGNPKSDEIIDFGSYTNRLYESNIWCLFPELKKVTIVISITLKMKENSRTRMDDGEPTVCKEKIYTREGYKKHIKNLGSGRSD